MDERTDPCRVVSQTSTAGTVFLITILIVAPLSKAADPQPSASTWTAIPAPSMTLSLEECLAQALHQQPAVAAQRASLAAAQASQCGLENLHVPTCLVRDLPFRRLQAALGINAAAAGLDLAERDTIYAVTRTYFTAVYARDQEAVAESVVKRLATTNEVAGRMLKAGARDVTSSDVDRSTVYLELARTKQIQAAVGVDRALAALREAAGIGPECRLQIPAGSLPVPQVRPSRQEVIAWAIARADQLIQAHVFTEVTCLEIDAQATTHHPKLETFAQGSDIHAYLVPPGVRNNEYQPAGVPPEMPAMLVGPRCDRVENARALNARAVAVEAKTRNLIALSAEDAYYRWEEASRKAERAKKAAEAGDKLASGFNQDFTGGLKVKVEDVINAHVLASQARSQYNEFLFQEILALADLERVTAGAFCAGLARPMQPAPEKGGKP